MTWRDRLENLLDIALRIPPLFVMDAILNKQTSVGFWLLFNIKEPPDSWGFSTITFLFDFAGFLSSLFVFCLELNYIQLVYSYIFSGGIIILCQHINSSYTQMPLTYSVWFLKEELAFKSLKRFLFFVVVNFTLQRLFIHFRRKGRLWAYFEGNYLEFSIYISFLLVVFSKLVTDIYTPQILIYLHTFYTFSLLLFEIILERHNIFTFIQDSYQSVREDLGNFGIQIFLESHWIRLHFPQVFRLFWFSRFMYHLLFYVNMIALPDNASADEVFSKLISGKIPENTLELYTVISKSLLVRGCDTFIALFGLTCIVSLISHYIGIFVAYFVGCDVEEDRNADRNVGLLSAMLFLVLALQTGLTSLEVDARLVRLFRNFCLLSTAIFHFVHSMVHPILMSVSASRNSVPNRHIRPLLMCFILILFPCLLLKYLWSHHSTSTWLLAVSAFSIEIIVKVLVTVTVYILFMIDAYRNSFWEGLDDYVYYIQSAGNTVEFLFGIFLFCNGTWIMLFESGGTIRAIMMCIHAYFNIWLQAKKGWKMFMHRRTAVSKINSLPDASEGQLQELNDLCAICFEHLNSAKITPCNHYFHGVCLRKWLYIQDKCPMCHSLIYEIRQLD
ncbi:protein TRC8 homolog [Octopus vulgaris]|uniref:Protein TRC8 homolog n=2 Tax=Octopus TaxID=6643 RepID=A0AA36AP80_OCTVU|nr:protein TRC8 homolog [Octopus sinensis]CAI9718692.1 protein TRC8 homolog [Octopus vulgaris]